MKDYKEFKNVTFINPITTTIGDDVVIGEGTTILPGCYLRGLRINYKHVYKDVMI